VIVFIFTGVMELGIEEDSWGLRVSRNQYGETNVMHFLFSLLRIKGLYMFRALLAHLQEVLHKLHVAYCVRVMSVGCYQGWSGTPLRNTHAIYHVQFVLHFLKMSK
jgi:hypothetical protein